MAFLENKVGGFLGCIFLIPIMLQNKAAGKWSISRQCTYALRAHGSLAGWFK